MIIKIISYIEKYFKNIRDFWFFSCTLFLFAFFMPFDKIQKLTSFNFLNLKTVIFFLNLFGFYLLFLIVLFLFSLIGEKINRKNSNINFIKNLIEIFWFLFSVILLLTPFLTCQSPQKLFLIFLDGGLSNFGVATLITLSMLIVVEFGLNIFGFSFAHHR